MDILSYPVATEMRSAVENAKRESDPSAAFRILADKILDLASRTESSLMIPKSEIRTWFYEDELSGEMLIIPELMSGGLSDRIDEIARDQGDAMYKP